VVLRQISIQDLESDLPAVIAEVESGGTIIITRHNQPVARLGPARVDHVHRGKEVGTGPLRPALVLGSTGRYLVNLIDDRGER
jgi:prevent-host-death family protein